MLLQSPDDPCQETHRRGQPFTAPPATKQLKANGWHAQG